MTSLTEKRAYRFKAKNGYQYFEYHEQTVRLLRMGCAVEILSSTPLRETDLPVGNFMSNGWVTDVPELYDPAHVGRPAYVIGIAHPYEELKAEPSPFAIMQLVPENDGLWLSLDAGAGKGKLVINLSNMPTAAPFVRDYMAPILARPKIVSFGDTTS